MKKQIILVFAALLGGLGLNSVRADIPADAVRGVFSVGAESKVVFAHGNLQYTAKNSTWSFATHQYDIIGADNSKIGKNTYGGAIDLFGWGTGLNPIQYNCASCATSFPMAGNDPENNGTWDAAGRRNAPMDGEYTEFKDWGENLSNESVTWRTLTAAEWNYLFFERDLDLFGLGKVNGVNGLILLPDNWENNPPSLEFTSAIDAGLIAYEEGYYSFTGNGYSLTTNNYTAIQWQSMEDNGAVFLPAAGSRAGQECSNIGEYGYYWSSTPEEEGTAYSLGFTESLVAPMVGEPRASGQAVRLVSPYVEEDEDEPATEINANFKFHPFTVNGDGGQVSFSQGNLQYQPKPDKAFRFAAKQNEYIGEGNHNTSCMYEGWIDLYNFGLGKNPTMVCGNCFEQCGQMDEDDEFDSPSRRNTPMGENVPPFEEFGTANNPIANGGNDTWRTMTADEWEYLFTGRENANGLFGFGKVDGVNGMIVLPDDWDFSLEFVPAAGKMTLSDGVYTSTNTETVYSHNTYSNQSWQQMEAAGAVFLPAAGVRSGNNDKECSDLEAAGYYMSSTEDVNNSADNVFILRFDNAVFRPKFSTPWEAGHSVRLVKEYTEEEELTLTIEVDPDGSGVVKENEVDMAKSSYKMKKDDTQTLIAKAATGYNFAGWDITVGGGTEPYSADAEITFTMGEEDVTLTANFEATSVEHTHNWGEVTYEWDGLNCTATRVCLDNAEHVETETKPATLTSTVDPTCETTGTATYTAVFENPAFEAQTTTETIEPLGHDWGEATYEWSEDHTTCTATRVCNRDASHVETETVSATVTMEGTTTKVYTAQFENSAFETQIYNEYFYTLTVNVNIAEGGIVKENADNTAAASYTMKENDTQTLIAEAATNYDFIGWDITVGGITSAYSTSSSITFTMGTEDVILTANFREKTHEHTWGEITYTWNGDYSQCTATRTCTEDASHVETETVNSTSVTAEPTCDAPGSVTYKATFVNPDFLAQEKAIIIEPLGHDWQAAVYTWSEDHLTCTATLPCGRDHDHDIVETVTAVPSTSGSTTVYTATFENPAFEPQTYSFTPSINVTMSQYGFLSLYADKAYTVPADLNAIIYTGVDGKNLTYQKLTVIPAYTGVVLYAKANTTYTLYETVTTESYPTNMLKGTLTDTPIDNANVHYILTYNEEKGLAGLFWPMGTNRGVGSFINRAGKAYLEIPSGMNVAPRFFTMRGEACEEGTAVDETQADRDGKYYDILGREVAEPQPQQIYIHNGQKVLYGK